MDAHAELSPSALWKELRGAFVGLIRATGELALAEGRLAVLSSVSMIALAVMGAATLFAAWLLIVLALVYGAAELGAPMWAACGVLAVVHILAAFGLWMAARRLARNLEFPNTRRVIAESWTTRPTSVDALARSPSRSPVPAEPSAARVNAHEEPSAGRV